MSNSQGTGAGCGARRAVLPGFAALLAAVLALVALAPQASANLLHLYYLKGMLGDDGALVQASALAALSPRPDSAPLSCQIDLARGSEESARQTCAGLPLDALPTVIHAVEQLGKAHGSQSALRLFQMLTALYPDSAALYYHLARHQPPGQPETVASLQHTLDLAAKIPSLSTWELVETHLQLAQHYLWWEAYALARDEAAAALDLIPNARAYRMQALAYAHLGEFAQANGSIQAAAATDASHWFYLDRGDVHALQGELAAAAADYRHFLASANATDALQGYLRLCKLYVAAKNSAAVAPCRALVGYNEADAGYRLLLGDAYAAAADEDAALDQYRRALALDPQNAAVRDRLQQMQALP